MNKYIVGLNLPMKSRCHESGVALLDFDGNILFAMNEERLSRKKLDGDFPEKAIAEMFKFTGIKPDDIFIVAVPTLDLGQKFVRFVQFIWRERLKFLLKFSTYMTIWRMLIKEQNPARNKGINSSQASQEQEFFTMRYYWRDFIHSRFPKAKIVEVDHHLSHAASAYFTSPWNDALIVTMDGAGNLLSSIIAHGKDGMIKILDKSFIPHSVGTFWGSITKACGFASGTRHGGKTTGLAAFGNPRKLIEKMRKVIWVEGLRLKVQEEVFFDKDKLIPNWNSYEPEKMKRYLGDASREDIAAAAQARLIEVAKELVTNARKMVPASKIVAAGGVFANVLMNQKILELESIEDIYIFPAMSDGGIALGAALYSLAAEKRREGSSLVPRSLRDCYLGPEYYEKTVEEYLQKVGARYTKEKNAPQSLAQLIYAGKIVAVCQGRMEYGPRALGNRSILYAPRDPKVNDWLNKRLRRSEFMPFAPVTLFEHIKERYVGIEDNPIAAQFMTVTYDCTDKMKSEAPACVHVDGTARPQVIRREINPFYYDIISEYHDISHIPTLINTSFNMHEEPIVCTPEDALRAFLDAELDVLAFGNILLTYEHNKHLVLSQLP